MKTPFNPTVAWLAAAMTVLTGGCVEPNGTKAEGSTNGVPEASQASQVESVAGGNASGDVAAAEPPVLRTGRASSRSFPDEVAKVIELVESGAGEEVTLAFVSRSSEAYELTLDDVLYLRDIGIPDSVVAAMMRRGAELRHQQAEVAALQTNLVSAVAEIKQALASRDEAVAAEAASNGAAPAPAGVEVAGAAGPAPLPQPTASVPADAPSEVQPFYESLSPYGSWYQVPSYGWVWQPSVVVVNRGWTPYNQGGRWVWSDWGWYWSSEYSWGWAPFHYGRWSTYPGLGWCWVPGTVWGPSWVTWRSHGSYVGWAPLPPACGWSSGVGLTWYGSGVSVGFNFGLAPSCYTFVSYGNFGHRHVSRHALSHDHVKTVYNNSTVVNNVINGDNNTIINHGVGYDKVASLSRSEIPKARIEPLPTSVTQPVRVDRMERSKDGLVVYRPTAVAESGGRPTALRAEARPVSSTPSRVTASGAPSRSTASVPSRPGYDSRFSASPASPATAGAKPIETRGAIRSGASSTPTAPGAATTRPLAGPSRTPTVSRSPALNPAGTAPKGIDGRTQPQSRSVAPSTATTPSPGAVLGPSRQTTPVPLADPSRYLPRSATPVGRPVVPAAGTTKPAGESRGTMTAPVAPAAPTAPYSAGGTRSVYTPSRQAVPQAAPKVDYSRPPSGANAAPGAMRAPVYTPSAAAPRPTYSAPAPATRAPSAPIAPRQSFSAPAPAMSAPRPSYSAPAPAMSAPRPSYSAPAPARSTPSPGPSPSASGRGGGSQGSRTQTN